MFNLAVEHGKLENSVTPDLSTPFIPSGFCKSHPTGKKDEVSGEMHIANDSIIEDGSGYSVFATVRFY